MRYYKAFEIPVKPYIQWDCFANTDEEYMEFGLNTDHLVVAEQNIPQNQYGVCPWKIDDKGSLIARSPVEMEQYRLEYEREMQTTEFKSIIEEVNKSTFSFRGQTCFMNESARMIYDLLAKSSVDSFELVTQEGKLPLKATDFPDLIDAYQKSLLTILNSR